MGPTKEVGCVICAETPVSDQEHEGHLLFGDRMYKAVLTKIFQHLLIPKNDAEVLYWVCRDERFCSSCLQIVEEIEEFQSKIQALELALQHKAEVLGNVIASSSKFNDKSYGIKVSRNSSEKVVELWKKFRNPVLQSYKTGLLPNPSVQVAKTEDTVVRLKRNAPPRELNSSCKRVREEFLNNDDDEVCNNEGFDDDDHHQSMGDFVDPDDDSQSNNEDEDDYEDSSHVPAEGDNKSSGALQSMYIEKDELHAALPNGSDLITSYGCPKCNFCAPFDISQCKNNRAAWRLLTKAKGVLIRHYGKEHCAVRFEDFLVDSKSGSEYYTCSLCSEKMVVEFSPDACPKNRRRLAYIRLTRHYLNIHETVKEPPRPAWLKPQEESLDGLIEGLHYFRCPQELCSFVTKICKSKDKRTGLPKLANHYMRMHEVKGWCHTEKDGKYPCLVKLHDNKQAFKCPRCDYTVQIKSSQDKNVYLKRKAFCELLDHFIQHVYSPPKAKSAMKCTLCEEVVRFPDDWKPNRVGDGEKKMKSLLLKHYRKAHRQDEIPQLDYYERVPVLLSQAQSTVNSSDSGDVLSQAVVNFQENVSKWESSEEVFGNHL